MDYMITQFVIDQDQHLKQIRNEVKCYWTELRSHVMKVNSHLPHEINGIELDITPYCNYKELFDTSVIEINMDGYTTIVLEAMITFYGWTFEIYESSQGASVATISTYFHSKLHGSLYENRFVLNKTFEIDTEERIVADYLAKLVNEVITLWPNKREYDLL